MQDTNTCPVAALTPLIQEVLIALDRIDAQRHRGEEVNRARQAEQERALHARLAALEEAASHERATSTQGVMLQLAIACRRARELESADPLGQIGPAGQIGRHLYSAVGGLQLCGIAVARGSFCADFYLPRERNPHRLVDRALAGRA